MMSEREPYYKNKTENLWHSQNFLHDPLFVESLVSMTNINQNDTVLEIGAGKGIITEELAKKANSVIAIELDNTLAEELRRKFQFSQNTEIVETDFLKWPNLKSAYKVFSNIPFEYTSRIIDKLLLSPYSPQDTYLIMQDLTAERYIGSSTEKNTQISILLQPFYKMDILTHIDRRQYNPIPNVNTVLTQFHKREQPLIDKKLEQQYRDFIIYGYNQWKPTIGETFNKIFSYKQLKILDKSIHIKNRKPSELELGDWIILFNSYTKYVSEEKKAYISGTEKNIKNKHRNLEKTYRTRKNKR